MIPSYYHAPGDLPPSAATRIARGPQVIGTEDLILPVADQRGQVTSTLFVPDNLTELGRLWGRFHECLTETSAVAAKQLRRGTTPIEPVEIASALAPLAHFRPSR
jgi:hypothetical protein